MFDIPKVRLADQYNPCSGFWLGVGSELEIGFKWGSGLDTKPHFHNNEPLEYWPNHCYTLLQDWTVIRKCALHQVLGTSLMGPELCIHCCAYWLAMHKLCVCILCEISSCSHLSVGHPLLCEMLSSCDHSWLSSLVSDIYASFVCLFPMFVSALRSPSVFVV